MIGRWIGWLAFTLVLAAAIHWAAIAYAPTFIMWRAMAAMGTKGVNTIAHTERATAASRRIIPLLGVSLEAFREYPQGFPRYANSPSLTDTINKFLRENGLLESDEHTLYGLRHSFEDRMLAAGIDERIRRDLMGHSLRRERYGEGASLDQLHALLKPLAL